MPFFIFVEKYLSFNITWLWKAEVYKNVLIEKSFAVDQWKKWEKIYKLKKILFQGIVKQNVRVVENKFKWSLQMNYLVTSDFLLYLKGHHFDRS
jgi:hypothetical protein